MTKQEIEDMAKWGNHIVEGVLDNKIECPYNENHCVLQDVSCGNFTENVCELYKKEKGNYHFLINGQYQDPDTNSHILYIIAACKFNKRLKDKGFEKIKIKNFDIVVRNNYNFCLRANLKEKTFINKKNCICLGADWAFSWSTIAECEKKKQWVIINETHTIIGHPLWPCKKMEHQTVNQARSDKISMKDTLEILKKCYENNWERNKQLIGEEECKNLVNAFYDYEDWYKLFNDFDTYIKFWDLEIFNENDIDEKNIYEKFVKKNFR